jgi:hypothetical protein
MMGSDCYFIFIMTCNELHKSNDYNYNDESSHILAKDLKLEYSIDLLMFIHGNRIDYQRTKI